MNSLLQYPAYKHTRIETPFANKLFSSFTATMVWSGFGPYHGLCCEDAPTKCIGVIPTPWTKMRLLGLGILAPQPELKHALVQQFFCDFMLVHAVDMINDVL